MNENNRCFSFALFLNILFLSDYDQPIDFSLTNEITFDSNKRTLNSSTPRTTHGLCHCTHIIATAAAALYREEIQYNNPKLYSTTTHLTPIDWVTIRSDYST